LEGIASNNPNIVVVDHRGCVPVDGQERESDQKTADEHPTLGAEKEQAAA
jgi:hypothetical protein